MALLESCRGEIFEFNGLNLLVDFLFESPSEYEANETELNACERVLQKAAIAISRFCKESKYSLIFLELEGNFYNEIKNDQKINKNRFIIKSYSTFINFMPKSGRKK